MRCALLTEGLAIDPQDGGYVLRGGPATVRLPASAVSILMLCDGSRSTSGLAHALGHRVAPHVIARLLEQLEDVGLVRFIDATPRTRTLDAAPVRHRCGTCGGSCEGSMIGPLPDARVESIRAHHAELAERYPRLAEHAPVVNRVSPEGERMAFLNFPDKRCVFLGEDALCLLHRHYGMASKPDTCQRFPVTAVEVDGVVRVGVRPMCFRNHRAMNDAPTVEAPVVAGGATERDAAMVPSPGAPGYREARLEAASDEQAWLHMLAEPGLGLETVITRAARPDAAPVEALPDAARAALAEQLARVAARFDAATQRDPVTRFGRRLREIITGFDGLAERDARVLPEAWRRFTLRSIRRAVFLRELEFFPSVSLGVFALACGAWACGLLHDGPPTEEAFDDYAERLVAWIRVVCQPERFFMLFEEPARLEALLDTL